MFGGGGGSGGGGGREDETLRRLSHMIMPLPLHLDPAVIGGGGGGGDDEFPRRDERVPQWSQQETRDFIAIRAELERDFTVTKRNKTLWEVVAAKMSERGYRRSPDQCKCKWKNLVNRYKGKETSDPDNGQQCPFFDELHAVFTERENNMHQRLLLESKAGYSQAKKKINKRTSRVNQSSEEELSPDEYENEDEDNRVTTSTSINHPPRKRKPEKEKRLRTSSSVLEKPPTKQPSTTNITDSNISGGDMSSSSIGGLKEMLRDFFEQQQRIEMEWRENIEKRAHERRVFEDEWRRSMERLERERLMIEQAWRERDEQRRIREESRAEKRDALLTTLLNKLIHEN